MVLWAIEQPLPGGDARASARRRSPTPPACRPGWSASSSSPTWAGPSSRPSCTPRGGFSAVDEAWADPPLTTEQVLHFAAYVEDEPIDRACAGGPRPAPRRGPGRGVDVRRGDDLDLARRASESTARTPTKRARGGAATGSPPSPLPTARLRSSCRSRGTARPTPTSSPRPTTMRSGGSRSSASWSASTRPRSSCTRERVGSSWSRSPARSTDLQPRQTRHGYIVSGAETPIRARLLASTWRVARTSPRRAAVSGASSVSTRQSR